MRTEKDGVTLQTVPSPIRDKNGTALQHHRALKKRSIDGVKINVQRQLSFDFSYHEKRTYQGIDVFESDTKAGKKILSVQSDDGILLSVPGTFEEKLSPMPQKPVKCVHLSEPLPSVEPPFNEGTSYPNMVLNHDKTTDLRLAFYENAQKIS